MGRGAAARKLILASLATAMLLIAGLATSRASTEGDASNLIINSDLQSKNGRVPTGWKVHTVPACSLRFAVHQQSGSPGEFEIINDDAVETSFLQIVHLKPGWYYFTADIKIESLGTAGSMPDLFARAIQFPIESRVHPMGLSNEWQKYHILFKAGPDESDFAVGYALGGWGTPNSGRVLFRNPNLVLTTDPDSLKKRKGLEVEQGFDVQALAAKRYYKLNNQLPQESGRSLSVLNRRLSVVGLNAVLVFVAILGWRAVSPRGERKEPKPWD